MFDDEWVVQCNYRITPGLETRRRREGRRGHVFPVPSDDTTPGAGVKWWGQIGNFEKGNIWGWDNNYMITDVKGNIGVGKAT